MVHAAVAEAEPGEVLVLTMPEPRPVALVGELLATQAKGRGVAALLVDAAVRDVEELRELGLPVWARWVRVRGADKKVPGTIGEPVEVGGATIRQGDAGRARRRRRGRRRAGARRRGARGGPRAVRRARSRSERSSRRARSPTTSTACARSSRNDRARPRRRPHRPRRAAHAEAGREPALLRRRARDGGGGARGAVGLPARLGRLPPLQPEADRVAAGRPRPHRAARLEPRGARAARRRDRADRPRPRLDRRRRRARSGLPLRGSRRPRLRALLRGRALRRRPST